MTKARNLADFLPAGGSIGGITSVTGEFTPTSYNETYAAVTSTSSASYIFYAIA